MSSRLLFLIASIVLAWILAVNSGNNLDYSLSYLSTALLALSWFWSRTSMRNVNLRRLTRTQRSQVGQYAEETFEVNNRGFLPKLWLEIEDYSRLPWHRASRVISSLPRNTSERWQIRTPCTQRGRFRLGPMTLRSGDPLGIFNEEQELKETGFIVVYPLVVELTTFEPSISDLSGGEARRQRTYQITPNVATVRDYAPGDSLNRIHWPTTARARRLMTKEFELDPTADVWIYLDLYHDAHVAMPWVQQMPEMGLFALSSQRNNGRQKQFDLPPNSAEYVISVAASLARYFLIRDRAVGLSSYGGTREYIQTDRGERQLSKILEALAVVEPSGFLPFAHLIATDSVRLNRNDTILAISSDPNPEWVLALQDSQRRGVNSVAVVVDGNTFGHQLDYQPMLTKLEASRIPFYRIDRDTPLDDALSQAATAADFESFD
ncbi:DUF58 domain-containing protein [Chloroflexi bacterium TSY]|nr:DUF58 domain-containing protein [Chloroflexi bacterium TSY]